MTSARGSLGNGLAGFVFVLEAADARPSANDRTAYRPRRRPTFTWHRMVTTPGPASSLPRPRTKRTVRSRPSDELGTPCAAYENPAQAGHDRRSSLSAAVFTISSRASASMPETPVQSYPRSCFGPVPGKACGFPAVLPSH